MALGRALPRPRLEVRRLVVLALGAPIPSLETAPPRESARLRWVSFLVCLDIKERRINYWFKEFLGFCCSSCSPPELIFSTPAGVAPPAVHPLAGIAFAARVTGDLGQVHVESGTGFLRSMGFFRHNLIRGMWCCASGTHQAFSSEQGTVTVHFLYLSASSTLESIGHPGSQGGHLAIRFFIRKSGVRIGTSITSSS